MKKRIVIAGGGFAGLYAARYLDKTIARRAG
jgi:NADH dehydrogenase FAD-containing subunit